MIEVKNLTKRFGENTAVDGLSFTINDGEVFGFLGPNGAGKTTTIRLLTSLIKPSSGSASVNGLDVVNDSVRVRETVGILTENPSLYERMSAIENLQFFAEAYGVDKKIRNQRIEELLKFFDLWERRNEKVGGYSKGMKQKLAIARALVHEPKILFLDEPTSGLDPVAAKEIRDLIKEMSTKEKRTVLLCTHHLEDAEKLANRVLIINKGKMVAMGTPGELEKDTSKSINVEIRLENADEVVNALQSMSFRQNDAALIFSLKDISEIPDIVKKIVDAGGKILSVEQEKSTLEDVYLKIMGEKDANE